MARESVRINVAAATVYTMSALSRHPQANYSLSFRAVVACRLGGCGRVGFDASSASVEAIFPRGTATTIADRLIVRASQEELDGARAVDRGRRDRAATDQHRMGPAWSHPLWRLWGEPVRLRRVPVIALALGLEVRRTGELVMVCSRHARAQRGWPPIVAAQALDRSLAPRPLLR